MAIRNPRGMALTACSVTSTVATTGLCLWLWLSFYGGALTWISLTCALASLTTAGLVLYTARNDHGPVSGLSGTVQNLQSLASGVWDLTQRWPEAGHKLGAALVRAINSLISRVQASFGQVAAHLGKLNDASIEMVSNANRIVVEVEEIGYQSTQLAAASEQLSTNMQVMAASAEEMSVGVKCVAGSVEELSTSISEIAGNAERAASDATTVTTLTLESGTAIRTLADSAKEIDRVIEVIQSVAEQTNLLALNATIEAAHAGDAGKGFGVVAYEVKELARQTAAASEEIRSRISEIQVRMNAASQAIGRTNDAVAGFSQMSNSIAAAVEQQRQVTRSIADSIEQSSTAARSMAMGVTEAATACDEIARSLVELDGAVVKAGENAGASQRAGDILLQGAQGVHEAMSQYQVERRAFDASRIRAAHGMWRVKLAEMVAGKRSLTGADIADHTQCDFGKWYYSQGQEQYGQLPVFQRLGLQHEAVHSLARKIAEQYGSGQRRQAAEALAGFSDLTQQLFASLDELELAAAQV